MPELKDTPQQHVFFQAREISAFFPDGNRLDYDSEDIHPTKSPAGDDVLALRHQDDASHFVRLYLTTPDHDWRHNATYVWQLSMAWMRVPGSDNNETGWLYWNLENNIRSEIKVYSPTALFSTESITLHFRPMSRTPWEANKENAVVPSTKIIMKNVLLGAHLQSGPGHAARYRPCQSTVCEIVDGVVASEYMMGIKFPTALPEGVPLYGVALATAVPLLVLLWGIYRCYQRQTLKHKYAPIADDNDLKMAESFE